MTNKSNNEQPLTHELDRFRIGRRVKPMAHNRLTKERLVDILSDVAKIDDKAIRLSLVEKLTNFNN